MDHTEELPAILSICPGILGLERGIERAIGRINIIAYVEIEAVIIANLVAAMEEGVLAPAPVWSNIKTFNAGIIRERVDGIIGGYPCQPFSNAGKQRGTEDPRHLWPYILHCIATGRPVWCFFENVEGHLTLGYDEVYRSLQDLGYRVESGLYSAEEAGAPHQRNRLFIFAIRADVGNTQCVRLHGNNGRRSGEVVKNRRKKLADTQHDGLVSPENRESIKQGDNRNKTGENLTKQSAGRGSEPGGNNEELADSNSNRLRGLDSEGFQSEAIGGSKELEYTTGWWPRGLRNAISKGQGYGLTGRGAISPGTEELAIAQSSGYIHGRPEQLTDQGGQHALGDIIASDRNELANSDGSNVQGIIRSQPDTQIGGEPGERQVRSQGISDRWPARPGEEQYDWEEPRTTPPKLRLPASVRNIWKRSRKGFEKMLGKEAWRDIERKRKRTTESEMGATVNGYNFREDILRAAGNSVVEQSAEIAFLDLLMKHVENSKMPPQP